MTGETDRIPLPPIPPRIAEGGDYEACLDQVGRDPEGAAEFAAGWIGRGGGDPATHCLALARLGLGDPAGAADLLDQLARSGRGAEASRAVIGEQAAQAWLIAGKPQAAFDVAGLALAFEADDPDLLITRATAALRIGRAADAIADLDRALALDPSRADALVLRATAHRTEAAYDAARADVAAALALDPDDPAALLERGLGRQRTGDLDGARADFERAIELSPDTQVAELAQQDIALLEAGPDLR